MKLITGPTIQNGLWSWKRDCQNIYSTGEGEWVGVKWGNALPSLSSKALESSAIKSKVCGPYSCWIFSHIDGDNLASAGDNLLDGSSAGFSSDLMCVILRSEFSLIVVLLSYFMMSFNGKLFAPSLFHAWTTAMLSTLASTLVSFTFSEKACNDNSRASASFKWIGRLSDLYQKSEIVLSSSVIFKCGTPCILTCIRGKWYLNMAFPTPWQPDWVVINKFPVANFSFQRTFHGDGSWWLRCHWYSWSHFPDVKLSSWNAQCKWDALPHESL